MEAKLKAENLLIYQESLVSIDNKALEEIIPEGSFNKRVLVIADDIDNNSEEQILLSKMLEATGLSMEDIYLLKAASKTNLLPYINRIKPEKIICFGTHLDTDSSSFSKRPYKVLQINDIEILIANSLNKIIKSPDAKQALWNGLKKLLNL